MSCPFVHQYLKENIGIKDTRYTQLTNNRSKRVEQNWKKLIDIFEKAENIMQNKMTNLRIFESQTTFT